MFHDGGRGRLQSVAVFAEIEGGGEGSRKISGQGCKNDLGAAKGR